MQIGQPWQRGFERLRQHSSDLIAGSTGAIAAVPDGMAASVIVGVPPVHGLYASAFGPILGGLVSATPLLVVSTTSAAAVASAEAISGNELAAPLDSLLVITLLAGLFQLLASLCGLARLTSFVSHSVMTGFLFGIAVLMVLGQVGTFLGYEPEGGNQLSKTFDLLQNMGQIDVATTAIGCLTAALLLLAPRAGLKAFSPILALGVPSVIVAIADLSTVLTVRDVGEIPSAFPTPSLPDLSTLDLPLITGALAVATVVFVQTAGVSQGLPGRGLPGGQTRDLAASGLANIGVALFKGQPVGGSLGQSTLNMQAGARSRWAAVVSGLGVLAIILFLGGIVESVAMSSLAALLIVAGSGAINVSEGLSVWQAGWRPRATIAFTFVLTLLVPIQFAVLAGVILSALLYLSEASADVRVVELVRMTGGSLREQTPSPRLRSGTITALQVYGSLFYAGARTLAKRLPAVDDARHPAVILRLRGKRRAGATLIDVLASYGEALKLREGRLFLAGVSPQMTAQFETSDKLQAAGIHVSTATDIHGESVDDAFADAEDWLSGAGPSAD